MSESRRAPYRVTGLDEYGLPAEPPPLPPPPPPGVRQLSRRGLLTVAGGLVLGGSSVVSDLFSGDSVRDVGHQRLTGEPPIYGCEAWGARQPSSPVDVLDKKPSKILVHHTATPNVSDLTPAALGQLARAIQTDHMNNRGWPDSGQNFTISRGGYIAEGRHESLRTLLGGQSFVEGAHCVNQNDSSIGIENQGTYTEVQPPGQLFNALIAMCAFICRQYSISPGELYGHRDYWDTECPGDKMYALLPTLRYYTARALGVAPEQPSDPKHTGHSPAALASVRVQAGHFERPSWPLLRVGDRGAAVLAAQYLLRRNGIPGVRPNGQFDRYTVDAVYQFQSRHGMNRSGMIGGGSWPLLATPVRAGQGGDAELALNALTSAKTATPNVRLPGTVTRATWQRLLTASAPGS
jgi:hypothetical protein